MGSQAPGPPSALSCPGGRKQLMPETWLIPKDRGLGASAFTPAQLRAQFVQSPNQMLPVPPAKA